MRTTRLTAVAIGTICLAANAQTSTKESPSEERGMASAGWRMHDTARPLPDFVDTGCCAEDSATTAPPPADAVVLLGVNIDPATTFRSAREQTEGLPWRTLEGGVLESVGHTGNVRSIAEFGDMQLHLEFLCVGEPGSNSHGEGNSGVYLMERYELQILPTHPSDIRTYADGMAGAVYGWQPPLVNAMRPRGQWNSYDILFRRPRFKPDGSLDTPATVTVHLNGVLVHDHTAYPGPTSYMRRLPYTAHADRAPLRLQDHGDAVRFRNVWVRDLEPQRQAATNADHAHDVD